MNSQVYWSSIEYTYLPKASQSGKLTGGFVYAFVKAVDSEEALHKVTLKLMDQNIQVKKVEFMLPYDIMTKWETEEQAKNFMQLYKDTQSFNEVLFDTFYAYETEG